MGKLIGQASIEHLLRQLLELCSQLLVALYLLIKKLTLKRAEELTPSYLLLG